MVNLTKPELEQLIGLRDEIKHLEEYYESLVNRIAPSGSVLSFTPKGTISVDKTASTAIELAIVSQDKDKLLKQYREQFEKVWNWINSIEDADMRDVMRRRYIDGSTWITIARQKNEVDESFFRKRHDAYLKKHG